MTSMTASKTGRGRLALAGVCARIGRVTVLDGIDLMVEPGQRWGVVGVNGSGKSTLLRIAAGVRSPSAGTVEIGGDDLSSMKTRERGCQIFCVCDRS